MRPTNILRVLRQGTNQEECIEQRGHSHGLALLDEPRAGCFRTERSILR